MEVEKKGAAEAAHMKRGDRILAVGVARPRDENHLRRLLRVVAGDPIDITVERRRPVPTLVSSLSVLARVMHFECPFCRLLKRRPEVQRRVPHRLRRRKKAIRQMESPKRRRKWRT